MSEVVNFIKSDLAVVLNLTLRLILLGFMIFAATTYIPQTPLTFETRATISIVVVLIYSLIDALWRSLGAAKQKVCEWVCGCSNGYDMTTSNPNLML